MTVRGEPARAVDGDGDDDVEVWTKEKKPSPLLPRSRQSAAAAAAEPDQRGPRARGRGAPPYFFLGFCGFLLLALLLAAPAALSQKLASSSPSLAQIPSPQTPFDFHQAPVQPDPTAKMSTSEQT